MAIEYFCCFHSYREKLSALTDEQTGRIFRAAMLYSETGEITELSPLESLAFNFIRFDIDQAHREYERKCEVNRANASRRNRPQPTVGDGSQTKTETKTKTKTKTETKTEDDNTAHADISPDTADAEVDKVFDRYTELCPSLNEVRNRTAKRREAVRMLLEHYTVDEITEGFRKAESNPFLCGGGKNGWKANFDWLIQEDHFTDTLEGRYEDWQKNNRPREAVTYTEDDFFTGTE